MKLIVVGLGFGDEGKGSTTDYLSSAFDIDTVARYNGGCQAAHNVYANSIHHLFSQFGSATLNQAKTILTKYMLVEPIRFLNEADVLIQEGFNNIFDQIYVSEECVITTPVHRLICCLKELSRNQPKGTVGLGIGETVADINRGSFLKVKDLVDPNQAKFILNGMWVSKIDIAEQLIESHPDNKEMQELFQSFKQVKSVETTMNIYLDWYEKIFKNILSDEVIFDFINQNDIIFEGSQGTLIDQSSGFSPYITRTNCTISNAKSLVKGSVHSIGLTRAYFTRHGPGPFPTESELNITEENNSFSFWQKGFRFGWLDMVLLKYSLAINREIDSIGLTCVDKLFNFDQIKVCTHYHYQGSNLDLAHQYFDFDSNHPRDMLNLKTTPKPEILSILSDCIPVYRNFYSWKEFSTLTNLGDLPKELKEYINYIEEQTCVPISLISYGPDRQQKLLIKPQLLT